MSDEMIYPELLAKKVSLEENLKRVNKKFIMQTDWFGRDSVNELKRYVAYLESISSNPVLYSGNIEQFKGIKYEGFNK